MYYVWFDDTPRKEASDKLDEAIRGYELRFSERPSHVLVNSADTIVRTDVVVQVSATVQPNTFWLSRRA